MSIDMASIDLPTTLGALEIGTTLSVFLFGVATLQVYNYYSCFPDDRWQLKLLVTTVWALEFAHVVCIMHYFYTISILQYGHPEVMFGKLTVSMDVGVFLSGCITCLVQAFFAERVNKVSRRPYLAIFCWCLLFLRFVGNTGATVVALRTAMSDFIVSWKWLVLFIWGIGAAVDVLIAAVLCYDLAKRRKGAFIRTTKVIDRVLITTIQTGLVTSLMTLAVTICFLTMLNNFIWLAVYLCLARVFSNSLLASLNARTGIRQMNRDTLSVGFSEPAGTNARSAAAYKPSSAILIEMSTVTTSSDTLNQSPVSEKQVDIGV